MKIVKKVTLVVLTSLLTFGTQALIAAEVRSISREVKVEGDSESSWLVSVSCAEVSLERKIERVGKSGKWCAKEMPSLCSNKKVKAAQKVCGTHFERQLAQYREEHTGLKQSAAQLTLEQSNAEKTETQVLNQARAQGSNINTLLVDNVQDSQSVELSRELLEIRQRQIIIEEKKLQLKLKEIKLREQANKSG